MRLLAKIFLILALLAGCAAGRSKSESHPEELKVPGCNSPLGFIPEGGTLTGYRDITVKAPKACRSGQLQCTDGVWTGIYIHRACTVMPEIP